MQVLGLDKLCMAGRLGQAQQAGLRAQHLAQTTRTQEMTMLWMLSSLTLTSELAGASAASVQAAVCSAAGELWQHREQQPQAFYLVQNSMTWSACSQQMQGGMQ